MYSMKCSWNNYHLLRRNDLPACFTNGLCEFASYDNIPLRTGYETEKFIPGLAQFANVDTATINQETTNMNDEIPKKLSLMESVFANEDDKVLIKAGLFAQGELTEAGRKALNIINLKANKAELVALANTLLTDAKE